MIFESEDSGPAFVCVGLGRSGTGWLFDQLGRHPDFWMPPIKELSFFDDKQPDGSRLVRKAALLSEKPRSKRLGEREARFISDIASHGAGTMDGRFYRSLFAAAGGQKSGDISPSYAGLSEGAAARLLTAVQGAKVVLLVRDPVARAWSQVCRRARKGRRVPRRVARVSGLDGKEISQAALERWDVVNRFISSNSVTSSAFPTRVHEKWSKACASGQYKYFLLDDIASDPTGSYVSILQHLDVSVDRANFSLVGENRKSQGNRMVMTEDVRAGLVEYFSEELGKCASVFGGAAEKWPERYNVA